MTILATDPASLVSATAKVLILSIFALMARAISVRHFYDIARPRRAMLWKVLT